MMIRRRYPHDGREGWTGKTRGQRSITRSVSFEDIKYRKGEARLDSFATGRINESGSSGHTPAQLLRSEQYMISSQPPGGHERLERSMVQ
jgi:hypothetical protein